MHSEGYGTWSVSVCVCVCLSVIQHITFHMLILVTNDTNLFSSEWRMPVHV